MLYCVKWFHIHPPPLVGSELFFLVRIYRGGWKYLSWCPRIVFALVENKLERWWRERRSVRVEWTSGRSWQQPGDRWSPWRVKWKDSSAGGLMDEAAEDIQALWASLLLLFTEDSTLPVPHAVISCSITELHDNRGTRWASGSWRSLLLTAAILHTHPFTPLQTHSMQLAWVIHTHTHTPLSLKIMLYLWVLTVAVTLVSFS